MKISSITGQKDGEVVTINAHANLKAVANVMQGRGIAALPVLAERQVVGIVSEGDIVAALAEHGQSAGWILLKDVLKRRPLVSITTADTIKQAMSLMTYRHVRHLPVIDEGELKGIVSLGDIVKYRLEELEMETNVLRDLAVAVR
jgi:CBS domain-containing protein